MSLAETLLGAPVESVWRHSYHRARPVLIDGRPWGHGAAKVDTPPATWVCADCGKRPRARAAARHTYLDRAERCTQCARVWCDRRWPPGGHEAPAGEGARAVSLSPAGQQTLALVPPC